MRRFGRALCGTGPFCVPRVETYRNYGIEEAFQHIRAFSLQKPVVLVEAGDPLFRALASRRSELGRVLFVPRAPANSDRWIGVGRPVSYRRDSVRMTWLNVRAALGKVLGRVTPDPAAPCTVTLGRGSERIHCVGASARPQSVAINSSFHPNWRSASGSPVLMLSPTLMCTQVSGDAVLEFRRDGVEDAALGISAFALLAALAGMVWPVVRSRLGKAVLGRRS